MQPTPATTIHHDRQDLVNHMLAAALHARATMEQTRRTAALTAPDYPRAAADLCDATTALARIRDALMHAVDALDSPGRPDPR